MNPTPPPIQVILNGQPHLVPVAHGLQALLSDLGLPPQATLVEYNGTALLRTEWPAVQLADGDRLEILRIVAGG